MHANGDDRELGVDSNSHGPPRLVVRELVCVGVVRAHHLALLDPLGRLDVVYACPLPHTAYGMRPTAFHGVAVVIAAVLQNWRIHDASL